MNKLEKFFSELKGNEKSERTITRYRTDILQFMVWAKIKSDKEFLNLDKNIVLEYKKHLQANFKTNTVNVKIIALNKFFDYIELSELKLQQLKQQRKTTLENVMSVSDYERLLRQALKLGKTKIYLLMKVLAQTGIRISELQFITFESLKTGQTRVTNKGKERTIIIPKKLCKELKTYCKQEEIVSGIIFKGRKNNSVIDTAYIFRELKIIGGKARVKKDKVHAHSFRHLFAKEFLNKHNDITLLADLLGHSTLETTRVYTKRSTAEQKEILNKLDLN